MSQQADLYTQQHKKSKSNIIILSIIVGVAILSAVGAYWFINNEPENSRINTASEVAPIAITPDVTTSPPEIALTPTIPQQNENTPSALDILDQRRREGDRMSVETQIVEDKVKISASPVESSLKPRTVVRKPRRVEVNKKKPNWGSQPKGRF